MKHAGRTQRRIVSAWIGTAFAEADQLRPRVSKRAALMDRAEEDVLAYMGVPAAHRAKISSTNPLERVNGEIKRRADGVGIFPMKPPLSGWSAPCCWNRTTSGPSSAAT